MIFKNISIETLYFRIIFKNNSIKYTSSCKNLKTAILLGIV